MLHTLFSFTRICIASSLLFCSVDAISAPQDSEPEFSDIVPLDQAANRFLIENELDYIPTEKILLENSFGYIFESHYDPSYFPRSEEYFIKNRFTPTHEDVYKAEELLKKELVNSGLQKLGYIPGVFPRLPYYIRQYMGYIENGHRILEIYFIPPASLPPYIDRKLYFPIEGEVIYKYPDGYYGIEIDVDLTDDTISNFKLYD